MNNKVLYLENKASLIEISEHLKRCDKTFLPPLSSRVEISSYAYKLKHSAICFEAWADDLLIGLVAAYSNDKTSFVAYVTSVSVLSFWKSQGIATKLMNRCIEYIKKDGMRILNLEVGLRNTIAIQFYSKMGFIIENEKESFLGMMLNLDNH